MRFPGGSGSQITRHTMHRPPLPARKYSWYSFVLEVESNPQSYSGAGRNISMKNSNTLSGIEPAAFGLAAQCLI